MKKRIGRRLVSLLLTFVTILTMLPAMTLPALAATSGTVTGLTDKNIDLSFKGNADNAWSARSASGTIIRGSANGYGTLRKRNHKSTLTITNNKDTTATLSFDFTIEKSKDGTGTIRVDGTEYPVGKHSFPPKELGKGSSITVEIDSGKGDGQYVTIAMTNVKLVAHVSATVTFQPAENGSYKVGGQTITDTYTNKQIATKAYQVEADPAPGYQFMDWYDVSNNKSISRVPKTKLNIDKDCTIKARFTHKDLALFETGGLVYDDLTNAITAASRNSSALITQVGDGMISGSYTIPSGVTLLIPFDDMETLYTSNPSYVNTAETQTAYKTLTMASGSSITVNGGAISVGGKHFAGSAGSCCKATGPYGQIIMQEDSSITLNNGANLYAWGYITGDGQITANSGATVYEYFQVTDWRGGNAVLSMISSLTNHVFPFSQYYVQNIEAPLTIQNGAAEKAYFSVTANDVTVSTSIDFIGSTGLFQLKSGSITKKYVPATGRTEYTTNGTACLHHLAVTMKLIISYTIDSQNYVLPINGNMILNIASGKVTSNYDLCLLPGVQINIAKDAELEIAQDADLYVYDSEQWGTYCNPQKKLIDVDYSPTLGRHVRTEADLVDAKIDVNGTLTAAGSVYTTKSGANICSSEGTGKYVQQSKPGTESTTHQATQKGSDITYVSIPITPAQLKNADGVNPSYTQTKDASAGATFTYCKCQDCGNGTWVKDVAAIINNGTQGDTYSTLEAAVKAYSPDNNTAPTNYIKLLHNTTEKTISVNNKNLRLDLNGRTVTGDISVTGTYKLYGMDSSAKADYTTAPSGKIVGTVTGCAPTYQTPKVTTTDGDIYDRYVAIPGTEADGNTPNLSFHHFNISVTGYRFELAAPKCALIFRGEFRGDDEAKKHLKSLGFTLTDKDGKSLGTDSSPITDPKDIPKESEPGESKVVLAEDGAFLFEFYLIRSFEKNPTDDTAYTEEFSATAHATFDNGGTQDSGTKDRKTQHLSFQKAWQDSSKTAKDKEILQKFLDEFGIKIQVE